MRDSDLIGRIQIGRIPGTSYLIQKATNLGRLYCFHNTQGTTALNPADTVAPGTRGS